jgi:hypothetical protein
MHPVDPIKQDVGQDRVFTSFFFILFIIIIIIIIII